MSKSSIKYLLKTLNSVQKWDDGDQMKIDHISKYIPSYNRYIDPFFCTGLSYFKIMPDTLSFVNTTNENIYRFYQLLGNKTFKNELYFFIDSWQLIKDFFKLVNKDIQWSFSELITNDIKLDELPYIIRAIIITNTENPLVNNLFKADFVIDQDNLINSIINEVLKKLKRLYFQNKRKGINYTKIKLDTHIETAIKNAYFIHFRKIFNEYKNRTNGKFSDEKKVAIWLILTILSKKSKTKINAKNSFSFPYGGKSYNHKNLRYRINSFFSDEVVQLLSHTNTYHMDFEEFLRNVKPMKEDFLFVNPPINKEKNNINDLIIGQEKLVNNLSKLKSKWLFLTNETPYIKKLQNKPGLIIEDINNGIDKRRKSFQNKYTIIRNYTI